MKDVLLKTIAITTPGFFAAARLAAGTKEINRRDEEIERSKRRNGHD